MKGYLFDENLPRRLTFQPGLPVSNVEELGASPTDSQVWEYAQTNELVIITKDADFSGRMILHTPPPWVVHLRFGNMDRRDYHKTLARLWPKIETLLQTHKLLNVHTHSVEAVS